MIESEEELIRRIESAINKIISENSASDGRLLSLARKALEIIEKYQTDKAPTCTQS